MIFFLMQKPILLCSEYIIIIPLVITLGRHKQSCVSSIKRWDWNLVLIRDILKLGLVYPLSGFLIISLSFLIQEVDHFNIPKTTLASEANKGLPNPIPPLQLDILG